MRHKIIEIHPEDSFYDLRERLVGKVVQMTDMRDTEFDGFVSGHAYLYEPLEESWGDLTNIQFSYVKVEEV